MSRECACLAHCPGLLLFSKLNLKRGRLVDEDEGAGGGVVLVVGADSEALLSVELPLDAAAASAGAGALVVVDVVVDDVGVRCVSLGGVVLSRRLPGNSCLLDRLVVDASGRLVVDDVAAGAGVVVVLVDVRALEIELRRVWNLFVLFPNLLRVVELDASELSVVVDVLLLLLVS